MKCPECKNELAVGTTTIRILDFGREVVPALVCLHCPERLVDGPDWEAAERRVATRLMQEGQRSGKAVRFMATAIGIKPTEFMQRFQVDLQTIKSWKKGWPVPDEIVDWVHQVVNDRGLREPCKCGDCRIVPVYKIP